MTAASAVSPNSTVPEGAHALHPAGIVRNLGRKKPAPAPVEAEGLEANRGIRAPDGHRKRLRHEARDGNARSGGARANPAVTASSQDRPIRLVAAEPV